jgi:transcriptional regulator with XRE-family HTH domain
MSANSSRNPSRLGGFILTWLRQKGWSPADLAKQANIPAQSLSHVITGYSRKPELETLNAIAEAMDEPLSKLLEFRGIKLQPAAPDGQELAYLLELDPGFKSDLEDLALLDEDGLRAVRSLIVHYKRQRQTAPKRRRSKNNGMITDNDQ